MKKYLFIIAIVSPVMFLHCTSSVPKTVQTGSQWRGEGRDGIYHETDLLKEWPADGPELLWAYEGLGEGHTSAAIANEKLYITGLDDDNLILYVFDLNGKLLTKKQVGKEEHEQWPGPRSTVCINDGKLYIFNAFGRLVCLDETTFDEIWVKDVFTDFDGRNTDWGLCESPLIVDEKIFITPGGINHNVVALNKNTGALIWSSPGVGTISAYCSPQYISDQSIPMIVTSTAEFIIALNADTGETLWSFPQQHEYNIHPNTPLYHNGMIFSAAGYSVGSVMLRLTNGGKSVEQAWKNEEVDTQIGGVVRHGNYIYASGHRNRYWFCVDWNTGETMYKVRDLAPCNVIFADGMLYCYSEKGEMGLVKPNPDHFEMVSDFKITLGTEQHWAHPVIYDGVLYLLHGDALMAYQVK